MQACLAKKLHLDQLVCIFFIHVCVCFVFYRVEIIISFGKTQIKLTVGVNTE